MCCKMCSKEKKEINLLSLNICSECFKGITDASVLDVKYDDYKNFIRVLLGYYISEKFYLNPVS